jgi:hypothetical protein
MSVVAVKVGVTPEVLGVMVGVAEEVGVTEGVSVGVGLKTGVGVWLGAAAAVAVSGGSVTALTWAGVLLAQADRRRRETTDHGTSAHGRCKHR